MADISPAAAKAIKMAIELEKDGHKFFMDAASKTENELGKKMFQTLAKDEIKHLETFQKMFDTMTGTGAWRNIVKNIVTIGKVPAFEEVSKKSPAKDTESDLGALRTALDIEREAMEFFDKAIQETDDPLAKKIFSEIRKQEEYHYDLIQAQLDYVSRSGFWFDIAEFRMDGQF